MWLVKDNAEGLGMNGVPTRTRTWIDRLGGDCSILLNYGDSACFYTIAHEDHVVT